MTRSNANWPVEQYTKFWDNIAEGNPVEIPGPKGKLWYLRHQLYLFRKYAIEQGMPGAIQWEGHSLSIITVATGTNSKDAPSDTPCILRGGGGLDDDILQQLKQLPEVRKQPQQPQQPQQDPSLPPAAIEPFHSAQEDFISKTFGKDKGQSEGQRPTDQGPLPPTDPADETN